jgi:parallel beta-helix repeat protein
VVKTCKSAMLVVLALLLTIGIVALPTAGTVEANLGDICVPDDCTTIQEAVNNASSGDIIVVHDGTYTGNVDGANLTIQAENGTANCLVQAADSDDDVFGVYTGYVNISGFTTQNATGWTEASPPNGVNTVEDYVYANIISLGIFAPLGNVTASPVHNATGWVVGDPSDGYGTILHTTDGGSIWERQGSVGEIPNVPLDGVSAVDSNAAWVVGGDGNCGVILRTTDGGNTWEQQGLGEIPNIELLGVSAVDRNTAWAVGYNGTVLHTSDGGTTWEQQGGGTIPDVQLQGVCAVDHGTAWVTGLPFHGYATIFHTTDGGNTWTRQGSAVEFPDGHFLGVSAADSNNAWAVGGHTEGALFPSFVFHTTDGGNTWVNQAPNDTAMGDANEVFAVNVNIAWVVQDHGNIFYTENGGENWTKQESNSGFWYLVGVSAIDANTAWVTGVGEGTAGGRILHTTNGGDTWKTQTPPVNPNFWRVSFAPLPVHNIDTGENFLTIQAAIDSVNTTDGNTITVDPGNYIENVNVHKQLTVRSTSGDPANTVVNATEPTDSVFEITAGWVNIGGFTVQGCWGTGEKAGICLGENAGHCNISANRVSSNLCGILLDSSNSNVITGNDASSNQGGILLYSANNNVIINNNASHNEGSILLDHSSNNTITGNNASNNIGPGIGLSESGSNTLRNNVMSNNMYNFGVEGSSYPELDNDIDTSNLVDGKPIYYLTGASGTIIDSSSNAGTVYCIGCDNIMVKDLTLRHNSYGVYFYDTTSSRIENNTIGDCFGGIHLHVSSNNNVTGNTGIAGHHNTDGIFLWHSTGNTVTGNDASQNLRNNIILVDSSDNNITGNKVTHSVEGGIVLLDSSDNIIANNDASNSYPDSGIQLVHSSNNTLTGNMANSNVGHGIYLESSNNNTLEDNIANLNSRDGIYLESSNDNQIVSNDILSNVATDSGIHLDLDCAGNVIHFNNIVGNSPYGVYNENTSQVVDAENNWWGATDGPDDDAEIINGSGDRISTNVDAKPWLEHSSVTPAEQTTTATATGTASFSTDGGAITDLEAVDERTLPTEGKPDLEFSQGFFSFNITGLSNGQTVNIIITLPQAVPVGTQYWKCQNANWYQIPIGGDDGDNVITIGLTDGGIGDADGEANGVIVDPGGPGVPPAPTADFSATPIGGAAPLRVQFSDESTGKITSWLWDFDDGATAVEQNPTHTYMYADRHTVILTVTGPGGANTASTTITIVAAAEVLPTASFFPSYLHISPQQVYANNPVQISVSIANSGGQSGSYQAVLIIDGPDGRTTKSQTVGVLPGSCQYVVFTVSKATPGTYHVSLAGLEAQFTVTGGGIFGGELGTGGIVAIVVVAIIFIVALILIVRSTRREI